MTKMQLTTLYEYTKYLRFMTEKIIREAENSRSLNAELKSSILQEQKRRLRELARLEKALEVEIESSANKRSETEWPEHVGSPSCSATAQGTKQKSKNTGKKLNSLTAGSVGKKGKGKNANDSKGKRGNRNKNQT